MTIPVVKDPDYIDWTRDSGASREELAERLRMNEQRSLEQNDLLHPWCRQIANHINAEARRPVVSEYRIKELVKAALGNVVKTEVGGLVCDVPMPTSKYRRTEADLTDADKRAGFISMDQFLSKIQAWAAMDLGLELESKQDQAA